MNEAASEGKGAMEKAKVAGKGSARTSENKGTVKSSFLNMETQFRVQVRLQEMVSCANDILDSLGLVPARGEGGRSDERRRRHSAQTGRTKSHAASCKPTSKLD